MTIRVTPELLSNLRQKAENCQPQFWELDEDRHVASHIHLVAECSYREDAQFIADANPAVVLTMVEEIERLWNELQEKQRLIDRLCEAERNRWKSAAKAFGIKPKDIGFKE